MLKRLCVVISFLLCSPAPAAAAEPTAEPVVVEESEVADLTSYKEMLKARYSLLGHKRTYVMPYTYNWRPHEDIYAQSEQALLQPGKYYQNQEAEFQFSFMVPMYQSDGGWDVIFGYTHHAFWQIYNSRWSRPFRETSYNPEFFARRVLPVSSKVGGMSLLGLDVGYAHQSNGQVKVISRSWDRVFARGVFVRRSFLINLSVWLRLPEDPSEDDNRTILSYMGVGDISLLKRFGRHTVEFTMPLADHVGIEAQYSYPFVRNIRFYFNARYGYGQSLIEYNRETTRVGAGFTLETLFDRNELPVTAAALNASSLH